MKNKPDVQNPDKPVDDRQTKRVLDKQKKEIEKYEQDINRSVDHINKKLEDTYKFVCALRLDIIADKLEPINSQWSRELDEIADQIEKSTWE